MTSFRTLDDLGEVAGKRALARVDLNVPMGGGAGTARTRARAVTACSAVGHLGGVGGRGARVGVDLNVPMEDGAVTDDTRMRATLPTVTELADKGAIILLLAHFGRPKGEKRPDMSLSLVTRTYEQVLGRPVRYVGDCQGEGAGGTGA